MRIRETSAGFTNSIDIGRFSFFIDIDDSGVILEINDLIKQAQHFPRIIFVGGEPFKQKEEVAKFIKNLYKKNPKIKFNIFTNGTIRPIGIGNFDVNYFVNVQLKNSNIKYNERIKPSVLSWFIESDSKFIFYISNKDDFDEAELIIKDVGISKAKVYFLPIPKIKGNEKYNDTLKLVYKFCKIRGYNYSFDTRRIL